MGKKNPHLEVYEKKTCLSDGIRRSKSTRCSECWMDLHETARFCVKCGAWFEDKK